MKRTMKGALATLAIFGLGAVASADTIATSSTGTFAAVAPDTGTGTNTLTTGTGTTSLKYTGTTDFSGDVVKVITLGTFALSSTAAAPGDSFNPLDTFTVDISQTVTPGGPGSGMSTGDVVTVGTIHPGSGGAEVISFAPNPVIIAGKSYTLLTAVISGPTTSAPGGGMLQASLLNPTAGPGTPLPASAFGGAGLLALLAIGKVRRKLRA